MAILWDRANLIGMLKRNEINDVINQSLDNFTSITQAVFFTKKARYYPSSDITIVIGSKIKIMIIFLQDIKYALFWIIWCFCLNN